MEIIFLGTSGAWSIPELGCDCMICNEMRRKGERRRRTSIMLTGKTNLLIDCGPDIAIQLSECGVEKPDAVLLTHEHGDHYLGMDELVSFKRNARGDLHQPIKVYSTKESWEVIGNIFGYLEKMGVIDIVEVDIGKSYRIGEFEVKPFKTEHGKLASGSVGYIINKSDSDGKEVKLVYTSDILRLSDPCKEILRPDYLIIPSYWLNEPKENRANQLSFQRAIEFIMQWEPKKETFLVHFGDGDRVHGDPANSMAKKREPANPLCAPLTGIPYPIPLNQDQWQDIINQIISDFGLQYKITVAYDNLRIVI